jgi:uncharacterized OB-fold protein
MKVSDRLLPVLDEQNSFFWTAGAQGHLKLMRCQACSYYIHPYAPICPQCLSREVAPETVSGKGTVASFTINMQPWSPTMEVPFVIAIVALPEQSGLNLTTNLVNIPVEDVRIGMPVQVTFEQHEDVYLPLFEPQEKSEQKAST